MASGYSPWWKRNILYKVPGLFRVCPDGNYHWFWERVCYCMANEGCGSDGGVYDFKHDHWIKGDIIKRVTSLLDVHTQTLNEKIRREMNIHLGVSEKINETHIAFVAVAITLKTSGKLDATTINICDPQVSDRDQNRFSRRAQVLSEVMQDILSCEHGAGRNAYCEPCGRIHGGGDE